MYLIGKRLQDSCKRLQRVARIISLDRAPPAGYIALSVYGLGERAPPDSHRPVVPPEDGFQELLHL